jgi:hypothetical protein
MFAEGTKRAEFTTEERSKRGRTKETQHAALRRRPRSVFAGDRIVRGAACCVRFVCLRFLRFFVVNSVTSVDSPCD